MGVSLKDVAQRAGVSIKTVSNVVNNYQHVTPKMRAKVQQAIDELGYRPNLTARHLRKGRTGIIALAVPEFGNPYFAELAVRSSTRPPGTTTPSWSTTPAACARRSCWSARGSGPMSSTASSSAPSTWRPRT
ncbi:HTH-type transcriptional repressor PurR [Streptomyces hirsutus]